jgi:hypothetical protein
MRFSRMIMLSSVALSATLLPAWAGGSTIPDALNIEELAASAAPALPPGAQLMVTSKTPQPEVPGLPLSAGDKIRMGPTATTIRILPATDAAGGGSVSWSGYTRAGVVYRGGN